MRRLYKSLLLLCLLLGFSTSLIAYDKAQGWCENGAVAVTIPGTQGSGAQRFQRSYPSCTVTIYNAGTVVLSTIYSDNIGTVKANPFTASSTGQWFFYGPNGRYDVKLSNGGIPAPFTLGDFVLLDTATTTTFADGIVVTGSVGAGRIRADAQIEIDNIFGGHVLFSLVNRDATEEAAITAYGILSNGVGAQLYGQYSRFVNSVNNPATYRTSWGLHQADFAGDKTNIVSFSNGSLKLLAGDTSLQPEYTVASANSLVIGNTTNPITLRADGLAHFNSVAAPALPSSGKGVEIFYNGTTDVGSVQSYNVDALVFRPLDITGTIVRISSAGNQSIFAPATGVGIELLYRTDGTNDTGVITSYNRTTATLKPLAINGSYVDFSTVGRFAAGTPTSPTVGKGLEAFYKTNGGDDSGNFQAYDHDAATFKPLNLSGSVVRVLGNTQVAAAPTIGVGIEMYYRTDGAHDEGQLQAYNRATSTLKPLGIGGSYVDISTVGRFLSGTIIVPTTGKGMEAYYNSATDAAVLQSYDRTGAAFKPLAIAATSIDFSTLGRFTSGTPSLPATGTGVEISYASAGARGLIVSYDRTAAGYKNLFVDGLTLVLNGFSGGTVQIGAGGNTIYRCATAGALPVGALTINAASCGTTASSGVTIP